MYKECSQNLQEIREAIQRRLHLMQTKDVPFLFELGEQHGDTLGKIIIDQMSPVALSLMRADKPHSLKDQNLWIPPESRANNKPCVTNAETYDIIKANTHEGILSIM